jgi:hypothetical protein
MDLKKSKNILIFGPFAILALVAVLYVNEARHRHEQDLELLHKRVELLTAQNDSIQKIADLYEGLMNSDTYFFSGDYEAAEKAYEQLTEQDQSALILLEFIQLRQQKIASFSSNKDSIINDIQTLRLLLSNTSQQNDLLEAKIAAFEKQLISAKEDRDKELFALKQTVNEQKTKLATKEKVQVISFKNDKGNLIHYLGEVRDGKANGGGVGIFDTGGIYKGEWKNNQRHGKGTYEWKDGHKYDGEFVNGEREGQGTYIWSSGEKYVGQWSAGKRNGEGILYDKDNNISYEGFWLDDKIKK